MTPVLQTERLVLRAHSADDFAACCELWADPVVTRFIGGRPSTSPDTWRRMLAYAGHWQWLGYGYFLVTERQTGAVVGEVGLADFRRDIVPPFGDTPEAGWATLPRFHGTGLAQEALTALLAWADERWPRTVCIINPDNAPSLRLAGKLGYTEYARHTADDVSFMLLDRRAR